MQSRLRPRLEPSVLRELADTLLGMAQYRKSLMRLKATLWELQAAQSTERVAAGPKVMDGGVRQIRG